LRRHAFNIKLYIIYNKVIIISINTAFNKCILQFLFSEINMFRLIIAFIISMVIILVNSTMLTQNYKEESEFFSQGNIVQMQFFIQEKTANASIPILRNMHVLATSDIRISNYNILYY